MQAQLSINVLTGRGCADHRRGQIVDWRRMCLSRSVCVRPRNYKVHHKVNAWWSAGVHVHQKVNKFKACFLYHIFQTNLLQRLLV